MNAAPLANLADVCLRGGWCAVLLRLCSLGGRADFVGFAIVLVSDMALTFVVSTALVLIDPRPSRLFISAHTQTPARSRSDAALVDVAVAWAIRLGRSSR